MASPISNTATRASAGALSLKGIPGFETVQSQRIIPGVNAIKDPFAKPATGGGAKPVVSSPTPSGSSYKGVAIRPGSDADVAAQVRAIDAQQKGGLVTTGAAPVTGGTTGFAPTTPSAPQVPKRGLFENVVTSLANPKADKMTEQAMREYAKAVAKLQGFKESVADTKKGIYSDDSSARVMQGRDAAVQQANAEKLAALQGAVQEQQDAIGFGQSQQQLNQAAQQAAAGLAAPSTASYGQTVFDPVTGSFQGGQSNLDPQQAATKLAQEVAAKRMTYEQAVQSLGYAGGAGQQFLNAALQSLPGGYNIPLGQATLAGQAGVIGTLPQLQSADTAAEGIKGKITTYLKANPQLNATALAASNSLNQWIQGKQLTDPKYQTLINYLNEYTNTLAPILGVGGDATNLKTQIAQSFVNAAASGQSIAEVLENIQSLSKGKIQDMQSGALGGGVVSNPNSSGTAAGGSGSGSKYDW